MYLSTGQILSWLVILPPSQCHHLHNSASQAGTSYWTDGILNKGMPTTLVHFDYIFHCYISIQNLRYHCTPGQCRSSPACPGCESQLCRTYCPHISWSSRYSQGHRRQSRGPTGSTDPTLGVRKLTVFGYAFLCYLVLVVSALAYLRRWLLASHSNHPSGGSTHQTACSCYFHRQDLHDIPYLHH